MSVRIHVERGDGSIPVSQLVIGQLAEIVMWSQPHCLGRIVQRTGSGVLVEVGGTNGWSGLKGDDCRVRILGKGTLLEIDQ